MGNPFDFAVAARLLCPKKRTMPTVTTIQISTPIEVIGKHFTGDYFNSQKYVTEVQEGLKTQGIDFVPFKVMGVFYDNPQEKRQKS